MLTLKSEAYRSPFKFVFSSLGFCLGYLIFTPEFLLPLPFLKLPLEISELQAGELTRARPCSVWGGCFVLFCSLN